MLTTVAYKESRFQVFFLDGWKGERKRERESGTRNIVIWFHMDDVCLLADTPWSSML